MKYEIGQLSEQVLSARASFKPIRIVGGNTKAFYGNPIPDVSQEPITMDMRALRGVVNYEPSELVITAYAGTPLQELIDLLDQSGQMLAFDPPFFGQHATVGGCVSAGLSGPGRYSAGAVKDFVLGAHLLDAQGRILKFGGEVMKNVAGYDVSRMLAGSMGMFGAILQVSLKVAPKPLQTSTIEWEMDQARALHFCHSLRAHPLPVNATSWEAIGHTGRLRMRLAGAPPAIASARTRLGGDLVADDSADQYWDDLREQRLAFFSTPYLWRIAVAPGTPELALGPTLIEWGGGQRWIAADCDPDEIRAVAESAHGHATLFRLPENQETPDRGVFHPLKPEVMNVIRRLKQEFDPKGVFNPCRLVAGI